MTLFRQFFSAPHLRPGEAHFPTRLEGRGCWWNDPRAIPLAATRGFNVRIVGEAQFQSEIGSIVGGRCEEGHNCEVPAELVFAGDDRDPQAVGVTINARPVGWLPAELSAALRPQLADLERDGCAITCKAKIVGGWDRGWNDRGYFGVKLSLALPIRIHPSARAAVRPVGHGRPLSGRRKAAGLAPSRRSPANRRFHAEIDTP